MRLDQSVTVTCTDTDKEMTGTVVRRAAISSM